MLTFTLGAGANTNVATQGALDTRTRRTDSNEDTSHQRVFQLLQKGDIGALNALRDMSGAYGWVDQNYEAKASETESRGAGDCSDQASLWSLYINKYGSKYFEPYLFRYDIEGADSGHAFLLVRQKESGRVFAIEYGHMSELQNVPPNATAAQIGELARTQL